MRPVGPADQTFGLESVSVVTGYAGNRIRKLLGESVNYIHNAHFAETNSLYYLWLAIMHCYQPFVLLNCDLLFHPDILQRLLETDGSALAYDSDSGMEGEHMKISLENGYLSAVAKDLPRDDIRGENIGLLKFDHPAVPLLYREATRLVKTGQHNQWAPAAVSALSRKMPIRAVDISDLPWIEIEFPTDLNNAEHYVCPVIPSWAFIPVRQNHSAGYWFFPTKVRIRS